MGKKTDEERSENKRRYNQEWYQRNRQRRIEYMQRYRAEEKRRREEEALATGRYVKVQAPHGEILCPLGEAVGQQ